MKQAFTGSINKVDIYVQRTVEYFSMYIHKNLHTIISVMMKKMICINNYSALKHAKLRSTVTV